VKPGNSDVEQTGELKELIKKIYVIIK